MYVKRAHADELYAKTYKKFSQLGGIKNIKALKSFNQLLNDIAKTSRYKEGEMIMNNDLKEINRKARQVLNGLVNNILERRDKMTSYERNNYDCFTPLMTVTDHLFATTMRTLGCPHMPASFGDEMKEQISFYSYKLNDYLKRADYYQISVNDYYKKQRGKNADELREETSALMNSVLEKKGTLLDASKLIAEYQALKQRQDGHGAIWRFFHREENDARQKLLEDMEHAARKYVGFKFDLNLNTPTKFALTIDYSRASRALEKAYEDNAMGARMEMPEDAFAYEATTKERAMADRARQNRLRRTDASKDREASGNKNIEAENTNEKKAASVNSGEVSSHPSGQDTGEELGTKAERITVKLDDNANAEISAPIQDAPAIKAPDKTAAI